MQLVYKAAAIAIVPWLCRLLRSQACSFAPSLHFAAAAKFTTFLMCIFTWTDKRNCALHWIYKGPWEITAPWLFQAVYGKTAVFIRRCALNTIRCGRTRCYSGPFYKLAESVNQRSGVRPCVCPWVSLTGLCQINYRSIYGTDLRQIFVVSVEFWLFFYRCITFMQHTGNMGIISPFNDFCDFWPVTIIIMDERHFTC